MIELAEARGLLARAVMTQGSEFVYTDPTKYGTPEGGCFYNPKDGIGAAKAKTGCLIGVALKLAGGDLSGVTEGSAPGNAAEQAGLVLNLEVQNYFGMAQSAQDRGASWGDAFKKAEAWLFEINRV